MTHKLSTYLRLQFERLELSLTTDLQLKVALRTLSCGEERIFTLLLELCLEGIPVR